MKKSGILLSLTANTLFSISAAATPPVGLTATTIVRVSDDAVPVIKTSARDSVKYSSDRKVVSLYGDAKVDTKDVSVVADEIVYDATSQTLKVKNLQSLKFRNKEEKGKLTSTALTLKLVDKGYEIVK